MGSVTILSSLTDWLGWSGWNISILTYPLANRPWSINEAINEGPRVVSPQQLHEQHALSPRHVLKHFGILIYSRSEIDEINKGQKPGWLMIYLFILMQTWRGLALVFSMGPSLSCRNPSISWWCFIKAHFWWYKNQLIRNINPFVYIRWFHF